MEVARGISKSLVLVNVMVCCLWGLASQADAEVLSFSIENDRRFEFSQTQQLALEKYATTLLSESVKDSDLALTTSNAESSDNNNPHVTLGLLRTENNEQEYYWISPLIAYRCADSDVVCTPNAGSQDVKVGLTYIALQKRNASTELAEKLSERISNFKTSDAFAPLAEALMHTMKAEFADVILTHGTVSLPGELHANTTNLWVIADLVPLFSQLGERGELEGIAADLVRDVLDQVDMPPAILSAPWKRIAKEAMSKSNVMVFSVVRTEERDDVFHWVTPVSRNLHGLFGVDKPYFSSLNAVPKSYRIGTLLEDYRYNVALENGFEVHGFDSWQGLADALFNDEIDVIFGSQGAVDFGCDPNKYPCKSVRLVSEYDVTTAYVALSRKDTCVLVLEKLKLAAAKVRKSQTFNERLSQWSQKVSQQYGIAHHTKNGVIHLWNKN
jgi:polar amino acid transport system substrate-binding protein